MITRIEKKIKKNLITRIKKEDYGDLKDNPYNPYRIPVISSRRKE